MRKSASFPSGLLFLLHLNLISVTLTISLVTRVIIHSLLCKSEHMLWLIAGLAAWSKISLFLLILA